MQKHLLYALAGLAASAVAGSAIAADQATKTMRVPLADGSTEQAWLYFYNAPLGQAPRIPSGDYLAHVKAR